MAYTRFVAISLPVLEFTPPRDPACTGCALHAGVLTVCLPMAPLAPLVARKPKALLVVGESPGATEDVQGVPFIGPVGQILRRLYLNPGAERPRLWQLSTYADIYLTNAVKCHPPGNETRPKYATACRDHLIADLHYLQSLYPEVVVLCVGSVASMSVLRLTIKKAARAQRSIAVLGSCSPVTVFSVAHPGSLLARRNPSGAAAVCEQLQLLVRYFEGSADAWTVPPSAIAPVRGSGVPCGEWVALDIETYGAVSSQPDQHYFHAAKMTAWDRVPTKDLIQTICLGWRDVGGILRSRIFLPNIQKDMTEFAVIMRGVVRDQLTVVGTNLKFDLMMLRHVFPALKHTCLNRDLRVLDISVLNYLHNEQRDARSQKDLAALFSVSEYAVTLRDRKFPHRMDYGLWHYNAEDCLAAICLAELLTSRIRAEYPGAAWKLGPYCLEWYSDLVWMAITISERGVCLNPHALESLLFEETDAAEFLKSDFMGRYGVPLAGPGSQPTIKSAVREAVEAVDLLDSPDLELTGVTKDISTGKRNLNLLFGTLPLDSPHRTKLKMISDFKHHQKLVSTYLGPMLLGKEKKGVLDCTSRLIDGIVYPDWFIVPSAIKDDDDEGGTLQCRITCKNPALQTSPKIIKAAYYTRFDPGFMLLSDLSQIELRMAGLLSNDPVFMAVYAADRDLHAETALALFPTELAALAADDRAGREIFRQAGKRTNFLIIYRGGGDKLHQSLLNDVGIDIPVSRCNTLIFRAFEKYRRLDEWHRELLREAKSKGYLELPLVGATRLFWGSRKVVSATYTNTICNFPVQALSANVLISAQDHINREFESRRMRSLATLQVYDSILVEGPLHEVRAAADVVRRWIVSPPFYVDLCRELGRTMPLKTATTVYARTKDNFQEIALPT